MVRSLPPGVFVLAIAIVSALAGALLTWLVAYAGGGERRKAAQRRPEEEGSSTDDLLRVVRAKGGPAIVVQGKRLRHLREIGDRETGQETVLAIKAVLAFAEGWLPALREEHGTSGPTDGPPAVDALNVSSPMRQRAPVTAERARGTSLSEPLKLVEEIDALIQKRLLERPDLERQGIRLTRDVHGHPLIYVGQQHYRSADEIPDDEARAFVQETIQIWENQ